MNDAEAGPTRKRPVTATVFGVLGIVFGALGVLSLALAPPDTLPFPLAGDPPADLAGGDLVEPAGPFHRLVEIYWIAWNSIGLAASLLLLVSGAGLLLRRRWARIAMIGYGLYALVFTPIDTAIMWVYSLAPMLRHVRAGTAPAGLTIEYVVLGCLAGFISLLLGLAYGWALVHFLRRPAFVAAFEGREVPAGAPAADNALLLRFVPLGNRPALVSYYLGLFSIGAIVPLLGIVGVGMAIAAVVLGVKGLNHAQAHPEARGEVHARVGFWCGVVFTTLGLTVQAWAASGLTGGMRCGPGGPRPTPPLPPVAAARKRLASQLSRRTSSMPGRRPGPC